jgi:hypothetical protein
MHQSHSYNPSGDKKVSSDKAALPIHCVIVSRDCVSPYQVECINDVFFRLPCPDIGRMQNVHESAEATGENSNISE